MRFRNCVLLFTKEQKIAPLVRQNEGLASSIAMHAHAIICSDAADVCVCCFGIFARLIAELVAQRMTMQTRIESQNEQLEKLFDLRDTVRLARSRTHFVPIPPMHVHPLDIIALSRVIHDSVLFEGTTH